MTDPLAPSCVYVDGFLGCKACGLPRSHPIHHQTVDAMAEAPVCSHERLSPSQTPAAWCNSCSQVVAITDPRRSYLIDGRGLADGHFAEDWSWEWESGEPPSAAQVKRDLAAERARVGNIEGLEADVAIWQSRYYDAMEALGCQYAYGDTAKGHGIGGQAITGCGQPGTEVYCTEHSIGLREMLDAERRRADTAEAALSIANRTDALALTAEVERLRAQLAEVQRAATEMKPATDG